MRDLREFIGALYEGEYVSYSLEYFQNFLNFKRWPSGQANVIFILNYGSFILSIHVVQQFQTGATFLKRAFKV